MPPKRRHSDDKDIEKEKVPLPIRNRLAQKAFRERKSAYVKELEEKVYKADGDRLEHLRLLQSRAQTLVAENESLKQALVGLGREADVLRWENAKLKGLMKDTASNHLNPSVPPFLPILPLPIESSPLPPPLSDCIPFYCADLSCSTSFNTCITFKQSGSPPKDEIQPLSSISCKPTSCSTSTSSYPTSSCSCSSDTCGPKEIKNTPSSAISNNVPPDPPLRSPSASITDFSVELSPTLSTDDFPEASFASPILHPFADDQNETGDSECCDGYVKCLPGTLKLIS